MNLEVDLCASARPVYEIPRQTVVVGQVRITHSILTVHRMHVQDATQ